MTINLKCVPRWWFWPAMKVYWFVLTVTGMATSKRVVDWMLRKGMRIDIGTIPPRRMPTHPPGGGSNV